MKPEKDKTPEQPRADMLKRYRQYLLLEKSLSPNTLEAYMDDAVKLLDYMDDCNIGVESVTLDDLHGFAAAMEQKGAEPGHILQGVTADTDFIDLHSPGAPFQSAHQSTRLPTPYLKSRAHR